MLKRLFSTLPGLLLLTVVLTPAVAQQSAEETPKNPFYDLFVDPATGIYTVGTGPQHPATISLGSRQNVLFGGATAKTESSFTSLRSYTSNTDYVQQTEYLSASPSVRKLSDFRTQHEATANGFHTRYVISSGGAAAAPDNLEVVQDIRVVGRTERDSAVQLTTRITNTGARDARVGVRYLWDFEIGEDDGPAFALRDPDGDNINTERRLQSPAAGYFRIQDNDKNPQSPLLAVNGSINRPRGFNPPPVAPDLLLSTCWDDASKTAFDYVIDPARVITTTDASTCSGPSGGDNAVLYYFGDTAENAITLLPNETKSVTAYIFLELPPPPDTTDSDGDGLLDVWETTGIDSDHDGRADVVIAGLNPRRKDILIYYDWYQQVDSNGAVVRSHAPSDEALKLVVDAFANAPVVNDDGSTGITLHFRKGKGITDPEAKILGTNRGGRYSWQEFAHYKAENFDEALWPVYHYAIFTKQYGSASNWSSGISRNSDDFDAGASDFIVSLPHDANAMGLAGTIMHELGHNLGLGHGGVEVDDQGGVHADHTHRKPNHLSVMNYNYQFHGVQRTDGTEPRVDYSRYGPQQLRTLNENALDQKLPLAAARDKTATADADNTDANANANTNANASAADSTAATDADAAPPVRAGVGYPYLDFENYLTYYYCYGRRTLRDLTAAAKWQCGQFTDGRFRASVNKDRLYTALAASNEWENIVYSGGAIGALGAVIDLPLSTDTTLSPEPDLFDYIETHPDNADDNYTEITPAIKASFNRVLFASARDGNNEIYSMDADGGTQVRLTYDDASDQRPVISPDGGRIAFQTDRDGNSEIYTMNADGGDPVNLTRAPGNDIQPWYAADGLSLVFASDRDGDYDIYSIGADGSNLKQLTDSAGNDFRPVVSPDGSRIAFYSERDGNAEIYTMGIDGSAQTNVSKHAATDWEPSWSPDGSRLVFASNRDGNLEIYTISADGGAPFRVTERDGDDGQPAWSSDGRHIFFLSIQDSFEIARIDAGGGPLEVLTRSAGNDFDPSLLYLHVAGVTDRLFRPASTTASAATAAAATITAAAQVPEDGQTCRGLLASGAIRYDRSGAPWPAQYIDWLCGDEQSVEPVKCFVETMWGSVGGSGDYGDWSADMATGLCGMSWDHNERISCIKSLMERDPDDVKDHIDFCMDDY